MTIEIVSSPRPLDQYDSADNHALYGNGAPPPKPPTLFEIAAEYLRELDENEGEYTPSVEKLDLSFDDKVLAYKHIALMLDAKERAARAEAEPFLEIVNAFYKRANALHAEAKRLEARLLTAMLLTEKTKVVTAIGTIKVATSYSVSVPDAWVDTADSKYVKETKEPKKAVLAAEYKDAWKKLMAEDPELTESVARAAASLLLPKGVTIIADQSLQGLVKKS